MFLGLDFAAAPHHAEPGKPVGLAMLRSLILPVVLSLVAACGRAEARLFWQTYGATVANADGCGCAWNVNQDYFVPRHCHTGRYGLFGGCKSASTISPACKNLHPVYAGYCTPYGPCRYIWRDHVYKTFCGCDPLSRHYGPWHLKPCCKHDFVRKHACWEAACCLGVSPTIERGSHAAPEALYLCNVEPFGGELLGSISALTVGPVASGPAATAPSATSQPLPPPLNLTPHTTPGSGLPAPFSF
jgi:hypothetical protein